MSSFYSYYISNGEIKLREDGVLASDFDKYVDGLVESAKIVLTES